MSLNIDVIGFGSLMAKFRALREGSEAAAKEAQTDTAEVILEEVKNTAPVDTGAYRDDWRIEQHQGTTYLVNSTPHGPYLVFPNQRMVGSMSADDPGRGIMHNVRGIVKKHQATFTDSVAATFKDLL